MLISCSKSRKQVNANIYLLGNAKGGHLTPVEHTLCVQAGTNLSSDLAILYYPHLLLSNSNRVVTAKSECRSWKRNDSCIQYCVDGHQLKYALLLKIVAANHLPDVGPVFAVIKPMTSAPIQLCHDPVTQAKLQHIHAFESPRFVTSSIISTSCERL